ncbi:carboxylate-amine ligase [Silicimonas algicola]|uniref:Putative glutamate--cysteine ligase 2 n=1 Tax=Silicimonas algicola TaxID=1826607 RepID=A0A316GHQ9_9RHOB|nr:carboxylate-amine ligase [Silicimonas algicola]AZQ66569.1 carboxylate-amine ligase [Silicimonas algicola]PWK58910.1 carboxylate-amine ligase [Silicimonas algicola]
MTEPTFTMGIEEEYLLVDRDTLDLAEATPELMEDCRAALGDQVSPEFLRCQVEIGTVVCQTIAEAREDLKRLRSTVAETAGRHGLVPLAASCHPTADYKTQAHTDKDRYNALSHDLAGVARRLLISGMHVHIGIEDDDLRIDLMNQATYFLPHLLALSCSSPFWQGEDTGLASYRLTVFDNLPRTGLPPRLESHGSYRRAVEAIVRTGAIEDATKVWWDMRPSDRFPTLESRICDMSPRMEHALSIAALTQCLMRMLWRLKVKNQRWRIYDQFLVGENRWRAQRYGMTEGLIDFGRGEVVPFADLLEEMIELLSEDAEALSCLAEIEGARDILLGGNSADRQREIHERELGLTGSRPRAMHAVLSSLVAEFTQDL